MQFISALASGPDRLPQAAPPIRAEGKGAAPSKALHSNVEARCVAEGLVTLPNRLKRARLGIHLPLRRVWPRHRRWVRSHGCCVPGCDATSVDFAHLRSAANAGTAQKPHDAFGVSLCRAHHDEQHRIGAASFGQKYRIDLWGLAAEFAWRSPDAEMRASLKLVRADQIDAPLSQVADQPAPLDPA